MTIVDRPPPGLCTALIHENFQSSIQWDKTTGTCGMRCHYCVIDSPSSRQTVVWFNDGYNNSASVVVENPLITYVSMTLNSSCLFSLCAKYTIRFDI